MQCKTSRESKEAKNSQGLPGLNERFKITHFTEPFNTVDQSYRVSVLIFGFAYLQPVYELYDLV